MKRSIIDIWVGVTNGWDLHVDNNYGKTLLAKLGVTINDKVWGLFSMTHGAEQLGNTVNTRTSVDATWYVKPVSMLTIALARASFSSLVQRNCSPRPSGAEPMP